MSNYYVNKNAQDNGDHEVHIQGCEYMPRDPIYLGRCIGCEEAVKKAKQIYNQVNGCYYCCEECHTQ
jgi:hypothetical protein